MERETKKITTSSGKVVELKTYLTAGEKRQLRSIFLKSMEVEVKEGQPQIQKISGAILDEAENKAIELTVISFDGSSENILARLLELPVEEYDFILEEINKVTREKEFEEKKTR